MQNMTQERLVRQSIARQGQYDLTAQVTPGVGANLISFKVDGTELIYWDEPGFLAGEMFTGAFNMFPTPCRLTNCTYEFEGKKIVQRKRGEDVFIHGVVRDECMEYRNDGDSITSWLDITPSHPVFEGFPFECTFSVTHALHDAGLTVSFEVRNNGEDNLPFGYGIHPYWVIWGERKDVFVRIPCDNILELKDLMPTGGVLPVAGTELDLRELRNIDNLFIDNAFWRRKPGDAAELIFEAIGKRMTIESSDVFTHMIVYGPEGEPFVCVENLTACPDAPNVVTAGSPEVAGMRVVPPGEAAGGWIKYSIADG